jgi:hypothetical protein
LEKNSRKMQMIPHWQDIWNNFFQTPRKARKRGTI